MFKTANTVWKSGFEPRLIWKFYALALSIIGFAVAAGAQPADNTATNAPLDEADCTLTLANREICVFRGELEGYSPQERAAAAAVRLDSVMAHAKTLLVTTQAVPAGIQVMLDGKGLFVVTPGEVASLSGQTIESKAGEAAVALREALHEVHSLTSPGEVAMAVGEALLGLALFSALVWGTTRAKRWLLARITRWMATKTKKYRSLGLRTAGLRSMVAVVRAVLNFVAYLCIAFLIYTVVWFELRCFPYSRPWGDFLRTHCILALKELGREVMDAVPGLMVVVLITLASRMAAQVISRVFAAMEKGGPQAPFIDSAVAATTRRLLVFLVWVVAVVVAYPYLPGSQSLAFKGVTVFAGLVVSLGSSNIVNQAASGLLLIYSRALRVGDYVRLGETEGTVLEIGLCVTHIRTIKNEEVQLANSVVLGTATTNYSRAAAAGGLFLPAKVTIGYSVPWRQVHAMLLEAASRTVGLARQPQPFVLQTSLSDFYVEYELNASLERPAQRAWVQSCLHNHIQDVFNEHGVQIMSPHYWQDPAKPQVVPKSNWFQAPARAQPTDETCPFGGPVLPSAAPAGTPDQKDTPQKN